METKTVYVVVEMGVIQRDVGAVQRDVGGFDTREEARACLKAKGLEHLARVQREQQKFGGDAQKQERYAAALLEKGLAGDLLDVGTAQFAIEERQKRAAVPEPKPMVFVARTEPQDEKICLLIRRLTAGNVPKLPMQCTGLHQLGDFLMRCANRLHFPERSDLNEMINFVEGDDSNKTVYRVQGETIYGVQGETISCVHGEVYSLTVLFPGKLVSDEGEFRIYAVLDRGSRYICLLARGLGPFLDQGAYRDVDLDQIISLFRASYYRGLRLAD